MNKLLITLLFIMHSQLTFANEQIQEMINDLRWQKRIILLFDDKQNSANNQLERWAGVDFDEWDISVIKVSQNDAQLNAQYKVDQDKTIAVLIGKDGLEKWRSNRLVDFSVLEALIDKMPMRQNEKNSKK